MERGASAWLCTVIEAFNNHAVQLRLRGEVKDFEVFKQRLDNWEHIDAGVIKIYKCSDTATSCVDCPKCLKCEIRLKLQETAKSQAEWVKIVESNGGYVF